MDNDISKEITNINQGWLVKVVELHIKLLGKLLEKIGKSN